MWDIRPGIEPVPPALEVQSLNHWTAREVPLGTFSDPSKVAFSLLPHPVSTTAPAPSLSTAI